MATEVGQIKYTVSIDTKELSSGLKDADNQAQSHADKVGSFFGKASSVAGGAFKAIAKASAVGVGVGMAGLGALGKSAVDAFSSYQQLSGGVETLFKSSSDAVMANAREAYKTAGISANEYMEQATSFSASLLQSLGGDTAAAASYADKAIKDMSDNANKMGTDIGLIQNAYQGFAKGNFTMLDNLKLGYGGTQAEMARLINDTKVMGDGFVATAENINQVPLDKIIEGIHKVQENMGITGTTAKEASDTVEGSVNQMAGAWKNLLAGLGNKDADLSGLTQNLIDSISNVIKNVTPIIQNIAQQLPGLIKSLADAFIQLMPTLISDILPALIDGAVKIIVALANSLPQLLKSILPPLLTGITQLVTALAQQWPAIIGSIIDAAIDAFPLLVDAIVKGLPVLVQGMVALIQELANKLSDPQFITMLIMGILAVIIELTKATPQIISALILAIPQIIQGLVNALLNPEVLAQLLMAGVQLFMAVLNGWITMIGTMWQYVSQMLGVMGGLISGAWNVIASVLGAVWGWIDANVIQPVAGLFTSLINGVVGAFNAGWGLISGVFGAVWGWINDNVIKPVGNIFSNLWNGLVGGVRWLWDSFTGILRGISDWVRNNIINPVAGFFRGLWDGVVSGINGMAGGIRWAFESIIGIIKAPINAIIDGVNGVIINNLNKLKVPDWVPVIGGAGLNLPRIPRLYTGGIVEPSGRIIQAGDGGEDEWVVPESKMSSLMNKLSGGGGDTYNITVQGVFATSQEEQRKIAEQIAEQLRLINRTRFERGNI